MKAALALIPTGWKVALVACALVFLGGSFGLGAWKGYKTGYESADNKGNAAIARLQAEHDAALAQEVFRLNEKLRQQTERALEIGSALSRERKEHADKEKELRARIAQVTKDSNHTFSPAFVRLWNDATGAAIAGDNTADQSPDSSGAYAAAGSGKAAGSGTCGTVSEADVLAYIIYYGGRTQGLEAQLNAWIDMAEGEGWNESR